MAPSKRASVGSVPSPKKVRNGKSADPNHAKMQVIVMELTSSKQLLPGGLADMLTSMAPFALCTPKEERHQFQSDLTDMVGSSLDLIEQAMKKDISTKQMTSDNFGGEKLSRDRKLIEAESALVNLQDGKSAVGKELKAGRSVEDAAMLAWKKCQHDHKSGDKDARVAESIKKSLLDLVQQDLACMKEVSANTSLAKAALKRIQKSTTEFGIAVSAVHGIPAVLKKEPALRTSFEKLMIEQFEGEVHKKIADCDSTLDALRPAREERSAAMDEAQKELEFATNKRKHMEVAYDEAISALKQGREQLKAAEHFVRNFLPDMKSLMDNLDINKLRLVELRDGPMTLFVQLRDLEKSAEVEEEEQARAGEEEVQPAEVEKPTEAGKAQADEAATAGAVEQLALSVEAAH